MISDTIRRSVFLLVSVAVFPVSGTVRAQVPGVEYWTYMRMIVPEHYICYQAGDIEVDGRMDEQCWKDAPWTKYFEDIEGERQPLPRFKTRAKMLWNSEYFYFGVELEEPHIWGTLVFRDQVVCVENDIEVFIDPDSDNQQYYELEISPLNTVWDLLIRTAYRDGGPADHTWNIDGLKSAVYHDGTPNDPRDIDRGWSIEIAIPWTVLEEYAHRPVPPLDGDRWRVNFSRVEWPFKLVTSDHTTKEITNNAYERTNREGRIPCDNWVWSPQGVCNMHCPEMFGYVQFSKASIGTATAVPDPLFDARRVLHDVYYAQRDFKKDNDRYARTLKELKMPFYYSGLERLRDSLTMESSPDGYTASVTTTDSDGKVTLSIRQDSKVTVVR